MHSNSKTLMENMVWFCVVVLFVLALVNKTLQRTKHKNLPPSPPALPIIGHLHLLIRQPIHRSLHSLSQKYGPVISLKFGSRLVIVVSSPLAVEECFTKNDVILANRPSFRIGKYLQYNSTTLASADYGDHWRNLRRLSTIEIFSTTRLNSFSSIRRDEVRNLLCCLSRDAGDCFAPVKLRKLFLDLASNIMMRMIAGKRYYGKQMSDDIEEARQFREMWEEFDELVSISHPGDLFPILQLVDYDGYVKRMRKTAEKMDALLQGLVDEHRVDHGRNTMINHLLALQETQPEYYTDEIIKGLILILLLAGRDTTSTSLEWIMANLVNHPEVLRKAKEELESQVGHDRLVDESDFSKLHYLQSIILESSRLYPVVPLLLPHLSSEECTIGGYNVPRGAILFANTWSIFRDPNLWDDPTSFNPERFVNGNNEGSGRMFIPFGMGRRSCPGEGLAHRVVSLTVGSLIQCFECKRISEEKIDMTENMVLSLHLVKPLEVLCKARPNLQRYLS